MSKVKFSTLEDDDEFKFEGETYVKDFMPENSDVNARYLSGEHKGWFTTIDGNAMVEVLPKVKLPTAEEEFLQILRDEVKILVKTDNTEERVKTAFWETYNVSYVDIDYSIDEESLKQAVSRILEKIREKYKR